MGKLKAALLEVLESSDGRIHLMCPVGRNPYCTQLKYPHLRPTVKLDPAAGGGTELVSLEICCAKSKTA